MKRTRDQRHSSEARRRSRGELGGGRCFLKRLPAMLLLAWVVCGTVVAWAGVEGRRWPRNDPNAARNGACVTYSFMADGTVIANPPDGSNIDPLAVSDFVAGVAGDANVGGALNARAAIRAALASWEGAADIHFLEVADNGVAFNAAGAVGNIRFGGHDFAGTTLAHGYYPPPNGVSAAGDVHFDGDYNWSTLAVTPAGNYDLQSVALHEVGHAIGLTHAAVGPDVMDPTIAAGTQERVLTAGDTGFAQAIYGLPGHVRDCTGIVGIVTGTPTLPPEGVYLTPAQVHARYKGADLEIVLNRPLHRPFAGTARRLQVANGEQEQFQSSLTGTATIVEAFGQMLPEPVEVEVSLEGPVETLVFGKSVTEETGSWDTEMLSMTLSGVASTPFGSLPLMIRESPTLVSLGRVHVTRGSTAPESGHDESPPTGGTPLYQVESFFDVFTELSVDGGATWVPAEFSVGVNLVPEPSSCCLLAMAAALGLVWRMRRRG